MKSTNKISSFFLAPAVMAEIAMETQKGALREVGVKKKKKIKLILPFLMALVVVVNVLAIPYASEASAATPTPAASSGSGTDPLSKIDIVTNGGGNGVSADTVYKDLNNIMTLIYFIAGFISLIALVIASILLSTSGGNPQKRAMGFTALGMALLGGWVLYKAASLAKWVGSFGAS